MCKPSLILSDAEDRYRTQATVESVWKVFGVLLIATQGGGSARRELLFLPSPSCACVPVPKTTFPSCPTGTSVRLPRSVQSGTLQGPATSVGEKSHGDTKPPKHVKQFLVPELRYLEQVGIRVFPSRCAGT